MTTLMINKVLDRCSPTPRFSTTMGVIYHEVPTDVDETKDFYHSFHFDNEVGQAATDQQLAAGTRQRRPTKFRFLTVSILFCMAYFVFRGVVGSNGVAGLRRKCGVLMRRPGALGSHGVYRNLTTAKSGQLPTHYTLPSGDKIPSVALGTLVCPIENASVLMSSSQVSGVLVREK